MDDVDDVMSNECDSAVGLRLGLLTMLITPSLIVLTRWPLSNSEFSNIKFVVKGYG